MNPNIIVNSINSLYGCLEVYVVWNRALMSSDILNISSIINPIGININLKCFLYSDKLIINGLPSKLNIYIQNILDNSYKNIQELTNVGTNSSSLSISF